MTTTINLPIAPSIGDLVPLVTWVLAQDVLRVQGGINQLLVRQPSVDVDGQYKPPFSNTYGPKNAWDLPAWNGDEEAPAAWILKAVGTNQRRVLAHLIAGGIDGVWTGELRRTAGYDDSTSMSGVFKAIGGRFRSTGLRPVWNGGEKDSQKGQRLSVQNEKAGALFARIIKKEYPELAEEFDIG